MVEALPFTVTDVFYWNLYSNARVKVNQGGSGSSKTISILQLIWIDLMANDGWDALVVAEDIPNLKRGAIKDFFDRIVDQSPAVAASIKSYNKSDRVVTFTNGSTLTFDSFDSKQDAKSGKRDIAFFNEANGITYEIYKEIAMRTFQKIYVDFNPTAAFWAHSELQRSDVEWFYSNYTHNPYCPQSVIDEIERYKVTSPMDWIVYGLGKTGNVQGLIFRHVEIVESFPIYTSWTAQFLDFGFSSDPSAAGRIGPSDGKLYGEELLYERGLTAPALSDRMDVAGMDRIEPLWCDAANPMLIAELVDLGWNAIGAPKGPGSLNAGITKLKSYEAICLTRESVNWRKEQANYKWQVDKKTGKPMNRPIDAWNHCWDGARYAHAGHSHGSMNSSIHYG